MGGTRCFHSRPVDSGSLVIWSYQRRHAGAEVTIHIHILYINVTLTIFISCTLFCTFCCWNECCRFLLFWPFEPWIHIKLYTHLHPMVSRYSMLWKLTVIITYHTAYVCLSTVVRFIILVLVNICQFSSLSVQNAVCLHPLRLEPVAELVISQNLRPLAKLFKQATGSQLVGKTDILQVLISGRRVLLLKTFFPRPPEVVLFWLSRLFQVRSLNLQHCHSFSRSRPCFCVSKSNALNNAEAMNGVCFGRDVASHSSCGMKSHIARNIVAVYSRMCLLMNYHVHLARWLTMDYISSLM